MIRVWRKSAMPSMHCLCRSQKRTRPTLDWEAECFCAKTCVNSSKVFKVLLASSVAQPVNSSWHQAIYLSVQTPKVSQATQGSKGTREPHVIVACSGVGISWHSMVFELQAMQSDESMMLQNACETFGPQAIS